MAPKYYKVGGYVRDGVLGIKSKDVDFAVEADSYEAMRQDLIDSGVKIFLESPEYLTIRGSHLEHGGVDYVLCRRDGAYTDGRHPETVEPGSIMDDLARRDFTINAMAIDSDGNLIDPFNGGQDIRDMVIRCVGDPEQRFNEDALRILRAIRFSIRLGFSIEVDTYSAMLKHAGTIGNLPSERIREELHKCFAINTVRTLGYLHDLGLTETVFGQHSDLWLMPTNRGGR